MSKYIRIITIVSFVWFNSITSNVVYAKATQKVDSSYSLDHLLMPGQAKGIQKGAIYYSPSVKNKVLMPVHFWGEVGKSGLHFIPIDSTFMEGISLAGGASSSANLSGIKVSRTRKGLLKNHYFDLDSGGDEKAFEFKLAPNDTVFVEKTRFYENRAYYTSLIGVVITILSGILVYRTVRKNE